MKRQPSWDQFEVALLVDAYIRIVENGENKKDVLQALSTQLRNKAQNEGLVIDATFRNLNGMMWQIGFVECAFKNTGYGKHMPSKLFQQIVDLYQNQKDEFNKLLEMAIEKTNNCTYEDNQKENAVSMSERRHTFAKWLCQKDIKEARTEYVCNAYDAAITYACNHRISKKSIWDMDTIFEVTNFFEGLHKDKIFNVVQKDVAKMVFQFEKDYIAFFKNNVIRSENYFAEQNIEQKIIDVVAEKYVYGFRLGSVIERLRLREYLKAQGIDFDGNDDELETIIINNGFVNNGKVLIESKDKDERLNREIEEIFASGVSVIYYESFFELKAELMDAIHIASYETLKEFLKEKRKDLVYSKNYFTNNDKVTEDVAVGQEILRIWGDNTLASIDELAEKLPLIPNDKVRFYLSMNQNFIWVSEGIYTRIESIVISDKDRELITNFASAEIERKGYVSLSELPLESVIEENYELSEYAILFGTYEKCLKERFCLHGRIITKEDAGFDAQKLMKQFCDDIDEITLDEAIAKVESFTGVADRRIAYPALYDSLIRVNEQLFVAQDKIKFDVEKIDKQIDKFAKDGFIAVKEISTFALFPECGYTWNHYILESYCYRFSEKYLYVTNLFNGKNAGAIVDRALTWDYSEIMAHAVARSNVNLEESIIGKYLYDTGYMARSKFGGISEIAEYAKKIREEEN